jgi:hypothetical protein
MLSPLFYTFLRWLMSDDAAAFVRLFGCVDPIYGVIVHDHFFYHVPFDRFPAAINLQARRLGAFFHWCTSLAILIDAVYTWSKEAYPAVMQCPVCGCVVSDLYVYICPRKYCQSDLEYDARDKERTDIIQFLTSLTSPP